MKKVMKKELDALKKLILESEDSGPETKKACLAMINASEGLTKPVFYTGSSDDIAYGVHNMLSSNGTTYLGEKMKPIDTIFQFSHHCGYFIKPGHFVSPGKDEKKNTYTIWLSPVPYDIKAIEVTEKQVGAI